MDDNPWEHGALQDSEEALPPMRTEDLKSAESSYEASTGVGADGFHPKVSLDLSTEMCGKLCSSWRNWNNAVTGQIRPVRCCSFSLVSKNITRARPMALLPTLILWWEWMVAPGGTRMEETVQS